MKTAGKLQTVLRYKKAALRISPVYDLYWKFATERQAIMFRRLSNSPGPWTTDPILRQHRFTNVYRASDRVSQYLIKNVIYNPAYLDTPVEVAFRILLFKFFNKIETWELLQHSLGRIHWQSFNEAEYDRVLSKAISDGTRIYSAAYIMPPVSLDSTGVKHRGHLNLISLVLKSAFVPKLQQSSSLEEVFALLKTYPSLGDFLAFQLAIDFNYSPLIDHAESSFVVAGPGAKDGIAKTFVDANDYEPETLIALMMERQDEEFQRLNLPFQSLFGRPMQLIDCQNLFCEISKYTRVSHPEIAGLSGRTRIKQSFRPSEKPVQPWYPPKWGLNDKIPTYPAADHPDLFPVGT